MQPIDNANKRKDTPSSLRVLSLGAGVQSTTLALMAAAGEIEPPDYAIFADTQWEPKAVYRHLDWLMQPGLLPFPVHIVTAGDIRAGIAARRNTTGGRYTAIPWHIVNPDGSLGMGRRQCSSEYKLEPIAREIRRLLGKPSPARIPKGSVTVMLGISLDEAHRMKPATRQYMTNVYPLIERGYSRIDCRGWLFKRGYPQPPKSACIGCPFTSDNRWRDRRKNEPEEWAEAVAVDRVLREGDSRAMRGTEFMHRQCVPLDQVDFGRDDQPDLWGNECDGVCGV